MIEQSRTLLTESLFRSGRPDMRPTPRPAVAWAEAGKLYRRARFRARWRSLWARFVARLETRLPNSLLGRSPPLWDLHRLSRHWTLLNGHDVGLQTVPLDLICGSEGRSRDFDGAFYPLQSRTEARCVTRACMHLPNLS